MLSQKAAGGSQEDFCPAGCSTHFYVLWEGKLKAWDEALGWF